MTEDISEVPGLSGASWRSASGSWPHRSRRGDKEDRDAAAHFLLVAPQCHNRGMATEKITISIDTAAADRARRAVKEGRAKSVSAYVSDAVESRTREEDFEDFINTCFNKGTPEENAEAEAWAHRVIYGVEPQ